MDNLPDQSVVRKIISDALDDLSKSFVNELSDRMTNLDLVGSIFQVDLSFNEEITSGLLKKIPTADIRFTLFKVAEALCNKGYDVDMNILILKNDTFRVDYEIFLDEEKDDLSPKTDEETDEETLSKTEDESEEQNQLSGSLMINENGKPTWFESTSSQTGNLDIYDRNTLFDISDRLDTTSTVSIPISNSSSDTDESAESMETFLAAWDSE